MLERPPGRVCAVLVAVILLASTVAATGVVAGAPTAQSDAVGGRATQPDVAGLRFQQGVDTDSVRLLVSIHDDGSATWTVQYWTRLDDENTTAAFESLRDDIESDPSNFTDRFASRMRSTVDSAENATGREMAASNFTVEAETRTPPEYGVVSYSFRWEGFAAVDGDTIRVGDAIEGIFLDSQTRLVVEWPSEYAATEVKPDPDERRSDAVVWRGDETSFVSGEPSVVLEPDAGTGSGSGNGAGGPGTDGGGSSNDGGGPSVPLALGTVLVLGVAAAVVWRYRDRFGADESTDRSADEDADASAGLDDAGGTPATDEDREDLLSNEERVVRFVERQGGRVKQQEIVQAFDWTEARTSQIVRDLRYEGKLEGFRLGRENVLKLPDEDASDE